MPQPLSPTMPIISPFCAFMHTSFENGRALFISKGQIFDRKVFVIKSLAVFNGRDGWLFCQKVQNPVAARKGLSEIAGQSRHREHWAETAEDRHHTDEHCAEVEHLKVYEQYADNERNCNKQRYAKFGCRTCLCNAVFHLLRLFQKYIRTTVDLPPPCPFRRC